jgi:metal-sulfur cluster biosynthetic enzyme
VSGEIGRPGNAEVWEALRHVEDPELGIDVVNLGLVYDVAVEGPLVRVKMTLTSIGCPAAETLELAVKQAVGALAGVEHVELDWTFDPPWSANLLTEEGRDMLMAMGLL